MAILMIFLQVLAALYFVVGIGIACIIIWMKDVVKEAIEEYDCSRLEKDALHDMINNHMFIVTFITVLLGGGFALYMLIVGDKKSE